VRRVVSGTGKVLVTLGILILLFVAYQLWGTGIYTARAQNQLEKEFQASLDQSEAAPTAVPGTTGRGTDDPVVGPTTTATLAPPAPPNPEDGDVVAHLVISKLGVDAYVVQGTDGGDLRKGPGHYPATPYPGQVGNSAIAGHRTTYGAPFGELDSLEGGDIIDVTTLQGSFRYRVYDKVVVSPSMTEVLEAPGPGDPRQAILTLTTCHPKYSAAQRLIVQAELVVPDGAPLPSSVDPRDPAVRKAAGKDPLSGDTGPITPTIVAGIILAIVGGLWWLLFHRHPRWTTWLIGVVPFAVALAVFFYLFERVLPANY
jgi:sortase A